MINNRHVFQGEAAADELCRHLMRFLYDASTHGHGLTRKELEEKVQDCIKDSSMSFNPPSSYSRVFAEALEIIVRPKPQTPSGVHYGAVYRKEEINGASIFVFYHSKEDMQEFPSRGSVVTTSLMSSARTLANGSKGKITLDNLIEHIRRFLDRQGYEGADKERLDMFLIEAGYVPFEGKLHPDSRSKLNQAWQKAIGVAGKYPQGSHDIAADTIIKAPDVTKPMTKGRFVSKLYLHRFAPDSYYNPPKPQDSHQAPPQSTDAIKAEAVVEDGEAFVDLVFGRYDANGTFVEESRARYYDPESLELIGSGEFSATFRLRNGSTITIVLE